jgi:hypothetical protein
MSSDDYSRAREWHKLSNWNTYCITASQQQSTRGLTVAKACPQTTGKVI